MRLRLAAIDAPEKAQPCFEAAKSFLESLAPVGDAVEVHPLGIWTHGRQVAWLQVADRKEGNLSLILTRAGYAFRYPGTPCHPHCDGIAKAQEQAQGLRRGCWRLQGLEMPWEYRKRVRDGG